MEDKVIIELFFNRDANSITEADKKYGKYCYKIAFNILANKEDAEECVNDTFFAAWENIPPHNPEILSAYLGKIARNLSLKKYRFKNAQKRDVNNQLSLDELNECIPSASDILEQLDIKETAKIIDGFLRNLSKKDRYIFIRRYWYLDSLDSICSFTGLNKGQLKMRLLRIRKKLLLKLNEEGAKLWKKKNYKTQ